MTHLFIRPPPMHMWVVSSFRSGTGCHDEYSGIFLRYNRWVKGLHFFFYLLLKDTAKLPLLVISEKNSRKIKNLFQTEKPRARSAARLPPGKASADSCSQPCSPPQSPPQITPG